MGLPSNSLLLRLKIHHLALAKTIGSTSFQVEENSHQPAAAQDPDVNVRPSDFSPPGASHLGQILDSVHSQPGATILEAEGEVQGAPLEQIGRSQDGHNKPQSLPSGKHPGAEGDF